MEPIVVEPKTSEQEPNLAFKSGCHRVECSQPRARDDERRGLFQPSRQQVRDARNWLARTIARRAVEILKAQETGP